MEDWDHWWERVAQRTWRSALRSPGAFWGRQSLRQLEVEDRARLTEAQVVATRPAFTAVLAGGAGLLAITGVFQWLGLAPGIGYPLWVVFVVTLLLLTFSWANLALRDWRLRLLVMLSSMVMLSIFMSIPPPGTELQYPIRTGLFNLIPIALLALTVRPMSIAALVATLFALTFVRLRLHGVPDSGEAMAWLYTVAAIGFGLMLSAYRTDFALEAYRVRHALWKQASTDSLTGLMNRAGWEREVGLVHMKAGASKASRSLVFFDVDHFKRVNDTWGHERGDSVLQILGEIIVSRLGPDSYGARLGGEEFAVLMIDATPAAVERFVKRVRDDFSRATGDMTCTVSAGIAFSDSTENMVAHLRRADEALYAAKRAGRDRISVAPPLETQTPVHQEQPHP